MYHLGTTLSSLRRQVDALMRKYARKLAIYRLRPVADQICQLWAIAVAKKQPTPDPLSCIHKVVDAGFRLQTITTLHVYLEDCCRYGAFPDADKIINKLLPPQKSPLPLGEG